MNLVLPVDMHLVAVGEALDSETATMIQSSAADAIPAETALVRGLSSMTWPSAAHAPIQQLLAAETHVLVDLQKLSAMSSATTSGALRADQTAATSAAKSVRSALDLQAAAIGDKSLGVL